MNIAAKITSLFARRKAPVSKPTPVPEAEPETTVSISAPGPYFDLHSLSRFLKNGIAALEKDAVALNEALYETGGIARVRYHSKFHNKHHVFRAPGEVRTEIAANEHALDVLRQALNISQTDPHPDYDTLAAIVARAHQLAA